MSHELTIRANGQVEMAYLNGVHCWHGLGNNLKAGATIEEWIEAAGMDWIAKRAQVRYAIARDTGPEAWRTYGEMVDIGDGKKEFQGRVVLFRSDNGDPLGDVSSNYHVVQPKAILEFWRDLVGSGGMELQTAGTLFGGKKLWALAKVGEAAIIDPRNIVRENLLIATSMDGSMSTEAFYCATVVVCNNTLRMALGEKAAKVKINHRSRFDADQVKKDLGVAAAQSAFETTLATMRQLADKRVRPDHMVDMTCELLKPGFFELDKKEQQRVQNGKPLAEICSRAIDNKMIGADMDGMNGTAWGWLNSVTEYADHASRAKSADHRMDSAFFGANAALKERAYEMAIAYKPSLDDVIAATPVRPTSSLLDSVIEETIL